MAGLVQLLVRGAVTSLSLYHTPIACLEGTIAELMVLIEFVVAHTATADWVAARQPASTQSTCMAP